jgi:DNA repair protein RadC
MASRAQGSAPPRRRRRALLGFSFASLAGPQTRTPFIGGPGALDSFFPWQPCGFRRGLYAVGTDPDPRYEALLLRILGPLPAPGVRRVRRALLREGLCTLARRAPDELQVLHGLPPRQADRLAAAFSLGRAVERAAPPPAVPLSRPAEVHRILAPEVRGLEKETFHALLLDTRHRLLERVRVSEGTLTTSLVHPREVFAPALRRAAAAVVVAHNHPSGDPEPSAEDQAVTRRLIEAGRLLGVPLLDHVVLGSPGWVSLRERMGF